MYIWAIYIYIFVNVYIYVRTLIVTWLHLTIFYRIKLYLCIYIYIYKHTKILASKEAYCLHSTPTVCFIPFSDVFGPRNRLSELLLQWSRSLHIQSCQPKTKGKRWYDSPQPIMEVSPENCWLPSGKLTWQWALPLFSRKHIFKCSISHSYVTLLECALLVVGWTSHTFWKICLQVKFIGSWNPPWVFPGVLKNKKIGNQQLGRLVEIVCCYWGFWVGKVLGFTGWPVI